MCRAGCKDAIELPGHVRCWLQLARAPVHRIRLVTQGTPAFLLVHKSCCLCFATLNHGTLEMLGIALQHSFLLNNIWYWG